MKKILFITMVLMLLLPGVSAAGIIGKPTNNLGLIGYWPLNEGRGTTAQDSSGYRNTATLTVPGSLPWVSGKLGGAIDFPGSFVGLGTSYGSAIVPSPDRMTISAWIYPRSGGQDLLGAIWAQGFGPFLGVCGVGSGNCAFDNSLIFGANQWSGAPGGWETGANSIRMNEWQHVVVTYDQTNAANDALLYINGVLAASSEVSTPTGTVGANNPANIGAGSGNLGFDGPIDEVRVYNRLLSASEVSSLYKSGGVALGSSATLTNGSTLKNGLVGHWTMDGIDVTDKVYDKSGNANNGYFWGSATSSAKFLGKLGQAMRFNGTTDVVYVGDVNAMDGLTRLTVSAWVKSPAAGANGTNEAHIVDKADCTGSAGDGPFELGQYPGTNNAFFSVYDAGGFGLSNPGSINIDDGNWHFLLGQYDGADVSIWVDGLRDSFQTVGAISLANTSKAFNIGGYCANAHMSWKGMIDDVRVYNRAISTVEISQLYKFGSQTIGASSQKLAGGLGSGLAGHWTFDGPDITTSILDKSGNGNNGYFYGSPTSSKKVIGKLGQALSFNGSTNHVDLGKPAALNITGAITLSAWVKFSSLNCSSGCDIIANYNAAGDTAQYEMSMFNGEIGYSSASGGYPGGTTDTTPITQTNRWYHVVVTRNATGVRTADTVRVYVDGVLQTGSFTTDTPPGAGFGNTSIGRDGDVTNPTLYFPGVIDDVRVYSRDLSTSEVKQLYDLGR
ncbi:MAG: LamG domain-containing protein [Candidatus Pacebacteria bacterium]|nr:LamG domain-containing protein [Candidatus Paceibacterota bacterium]